MIFVTIGTSDPFDRLLRALDVFPGGERLVVQYGNSTVRPENAECVAFLPYEELLTRINAARVVITHAGAGSVMTVLGAGKRPIVVPRLQSHGEAVDDHQVEFGRAMHAAGLVTLVEDPTNLAAAVAGIQDLNGSRHNDNRLASELSAYVTGVLAH